MWISALAACHPAHPTPQALADFVGGVPIEVLVPDEEGAVGLAAWDAWIAGITPGRLEVEVASGVAMTCRAGHDGHVVVRVVIDPTQAESRSGVLFSKCPFVDSPLPVSIRW